MCMGKQDRNYRMAKASIARAVAGTAAIAVSDAPVLCDPARMHMRYRATELHNCAGAIITRKST